MTDISADNFLSIEVYHFDEDLVALFVKASNGRLSAQCELYTAHDSMKKFAASLKGFPHSAQDKVECEFGTFNPQYAGGGMRFSAHCVGNAGQLVVDLDFFGCVGTTFDPLKEMASFRIKTEAHAIDVFVKQLEVMNLETGATACLGSVAVQ